MKRISFYLTPVISVLLIMNGCKQEVITRKIVKYEPPVSYERASEWADSIVGLMTLEEKVLMIGGDRIFYTNGIERLGIPPVMFADATQGVHLRDQFMNGQYTYEKALPKSTAFPCPILLASTWNRELASEYATAIGEECRAGGIAVLLGPGMNIYRHSQCGRNFEYFGEDPFLAARMIENYVVGLQKTGTIATLKHFLANNTDYYRRKSNSIADERTLNEIYLPAFKAGVDAGAMAIMTSYNQLNGEWTGQSEYVIKSLLEQQLGFRWLVMTDWWSVYDGVKTIKSGQDLEMPYRLATENASELVLQGLIEEVDLDTMVASILKTLYSMQAFNRQKDESFSRWDAHEETALQTAREGIVLLRNEDSLLPLENASRILLTGEYAGRVAQGGGAATVEGYNHVVLADALKDIYKEKIEYVVNASDEAVKAAEVVILNIGTFDSEGWDRPFDLPDPVESEISRISGLNPNVVVVVNSGSGINMSRWQKKVKTILYAWYPGQNGAKALAEIIAGMTNPSGKLPITIEKDFSHSPGARYIPEGEALYSGWNDEDEKSREVYDVDYVEGVLVGYRWYDKQLIPPLYPFGFGLSYTSFQYSGLKASSVRFPKEETIKISFAITNTGKRKGAEVAQLYVIDRESGIPRPPKELKGFEKVMLEAGESKQVSILLSGEDFSYWNPVFGKWVCEPGEFDIIIAPSSAQVAQKVTVVLI